jgi:hypothetical protein
LIILVDKLNVGQRRVKTGVCMLEEEEDIGNIVVIKRGSDGIRKTMENSGKQWKLSRNNHKHFHETMRRRIDALFLVLAGKVFY